MNLFDVIDEHMATLMILQHDRYEFWGGRLAVQRLKSLWFVYLDGKSALEDNKPVSYIRLTAAIAKAMQWRTETEDAEAIDRRKHNGRD